MMTPCRSTGSRDHHSDPTGARTDGAMAPRVLATEGELHAFAATYDEAYLLIGFGEKAQYQDVEGAAQAAAAHLVAAQARSRSAGTPFLLVYGGDPCYVPTIGSVVKLLRERYTCHVLAVQAAGTHEPEAWVDAVFAAEEQHEVVSKLQGGVEVEVRQVLYGGTRGGKPVGGARVYMQEPFYASNETGAPGLIRLSLFLGGGAIAAEELQHTHAWGVPWAYVPCRCSHPEVYQSAFGPVHDWVMEQARNGAQRLSVVGNLQRP